MGRIRRCLSLRRGKKFPRRWKVPILNVVESRVTCEIPSKSASALVGMTVALQGSGDIPNMIKPFSFALLTSALAVGLLTVTPARADAQDASSPLSLASARVSIDGTSNIHEFTAATTEVRITRIALASGVSGPGILAAVLNPGAVDAFEIAIRAAALTSPKEGLDKNMHKALRVAEFKDITFRLVRLEAKPALRAVGMLKIAGVEREVAFDLKTAASPTALTISGQVPLLMTDYGIKPPTAMLGMLKTDPKIVVKFETVLALSTTF